MVELTIDGQPVAVPEGSMVMQAATKLGVFVPHFCYHKKLSIAANCRMCLVDVEKAPKALPACATPVTAGMVVQTRSEKAIAAQKSVMEFLLINHPLDCPICDQGGECQLQDLAVGYGGSRSRYGEEKRVVFQKNLGPLVSAQEMSRCIHCTRCVRFGQEVAGVMELGMLGRGEHSEITTFVGRAIESELSGNMIDLCPVGALTSKPFRYQARTWELARRRSVSPHDSVGSNLVVQVKGEQVLRVVPLENEAVNECWLSDRDRFAYEGLSHPDRLAAPMMRGENGEWREVSWSDALKFVGQRLAYVKDHGGGNQIGALAADSSTLEELALLARLTRALGSENIDCRLRQTDPEFDAARNGTPWLGLPIAELNTLDRVLVVGSFLRKDHPLMAQRLRQATKRGAQLSLIDCAADDPLLPVTGRITVTPAELAHALSEVVVALAQAKGAEIPAEFTDITPGAAAQTIAASIAGGEKVAILLGNLAAHSPQASRIAALAQKIAELVSGRFGWLTAGGNSVGGYLAGAVPQAGGKTAAQMLAEPLKAYIVLHAEPLLDADAGARAVATLKQAEFALALTAYRSAAEDWADVMLPVSPYTETSGTFVNAAGQAQSFKGVAAPYQQTRPAWKVLRVLGNVLQLPDFDDDTSEAVRDDVLCGGVEARLDNRVNAAAILTSAQTLTRPFGAPSPINGRGDSPTTPFAADGRGEFEVSPRPLAGEGARGDVNPGRVRVGGNEAIVLHRIADLPIYRSDAIVRRAEALQTVAARELPAARMNAATLARLGAADGDAVRLTSDFGSAELAAQLDNGVPDGGVRVADGWALSATLGAAFATLSVERV